MDATADMQGDAQFVASIRGDLAPHLGLRELYKTSVPPDPYQKVMIISLTKQRVGLFFDQAIGNHQTVIKSLSELHADLAVVQGDGAAALSLGCRAPGQFRPGVRRPAEGGGMNMKGRSA